MRMQVGLLACLLAMTLQAGENAPPKKYDPRRMADPGIVVPEADRKELDELLSEYTRGLDNLLKGKGASEHPLLQELRLQHIAVDTALAYDEFFDVKQIAGAKELLHDGIQRIKDVAAGKTDWLRATGLVVRGYVSRIDGSLQPYGLVVPASYAQEPARKRRLEIWLHGRDDKLTELSFLLQRKKSPGEFVPPDAIVMHLYGRCCNAFKFAGETDLFEALAHVKQHYPIDEQRIVIRGFSMGGAGCWHFAGHHAGVFAAASPGAGFTETAEYTKAFKDPNNPPPQYEQTLWHLYDSVDYAENFYNLPLVAYSGEVDPQKQAADKMAAALAAEGLTMTHIIGKQMPHKYDAASKQEINRRIDEILVRGRELVPPRVRFTTYTLRYNKMLWVTVDGLEQHWQRARVDAQIIDSRRITVKTQNVAALTLNMPPGHCPLDNTAAPRVTIDGVELEAAAVGTDRSWLTHFRKENGRWARSETAGFTEPRKVHGLQGPIDDAFMDSFMMVKPTGKPFNATVGAWVSSEMERAILQWRSMFRGHARVQDDTKIGDAEIAAHNLVLWGDPSSNAVLAKIASKLPIKWTAEGIECAGRKYPAATHVPVFIFPNPLNAKRYVVINSSFTFREWPVSNAKQIPVLPDWAIIDISAPPTPRLPGKVAQAGFFDEQWRLRAEGKE